MNLYDSKDNVIQITANGNLVNLNIDETNNGSIEHVELMKSDYIELHFTLSNPVLFPIGTYCIYNSKRYEVTEKQYPKISTKGIEYTLTMEAYYMKWKNIVCIYDTKIGGQAGWSLVADIRSFGNAILSVLKEAGIKYNGLDYVFSIDSTVTSEAKFIEFSQVSILDALNLIVSDSNFNCEWWITENIIHFGKCELSGDYVKLEDGDEITSPSRSGSSNVYASKIYAFGSNRNIDTRYRKGLTFSVSEISDSNGQKLIKDGSRPLLPKFFNDSEKTKISYALNKTLYCSVANRIDQADFEIDAYNYPCGGYFDISTVRITPTLYDKNRAIVQASSDMKFRALVYLNGYKPHSSENFAVKYSEKEALISSGAMSLDSFSVSDEEMTGYERFKHSVYVFIDIDYETYKNTIGTVEFNVTGSIVFKPSKPEIHTVLNYNGMDYDVLINQGMASSTDMKILLPAGFTIPTLDKYTLPNLIRLNVPSSYFTYDDSGVAEGVIQNRLALPLNDGNGNILNPYVCKDDLTAQEKLDLNVDDNEGDVEAIILFEDEYPKIESTVNNVSSDMINYVSGGKTLDEKYPQYTIIINDFSNFKDDYRLSGLSPKCVFQTGLLAGKEFELDYKDNGKFTIVPNTDYGRQLPDARLFPSLNDALILFNYDTAYFDANAVSNAELSLRTTAIKKLKEMYIDPSTYECSMNMVRARGWVSVEGSMELVKDESKEIDLTMGDKVNLIAPVYIKSSVQDNVTWGRKSRIVGYEKSTDGTSAKYYVGESVSYSRLGTLESKVSSISYNGKTYTYGGSSNGSSVYLITSSDKTVESDSNAYSAKRSKKEFLSKTVDDSTPFNFGVGKDFDVKGNVTVSGDSSINGNQTIGGDSSIKGNQYVDGDSSTKGSQSVTGSSEIGANSTIHANQTVDGSNTVGGKSTLKDDVTVGQYNPGLAGSGAKVDKYGNAEMRSLTLWDSLQVPKLSFNRVEVLVGLDFQSSGGGTIKSVTIDKDINGNELASGTIKLDLKDGEYGAIEEGDLCMGIFHNYKGTNDTVNSDSHTGNIQKMGFRTSYFCITEIIDTATNGEFRYILREVSDSWTQLNHPCAQMDFAQRGSITNPARQNFKYRTTEYSVGLTGVNTWEFTDSNIYYIEGNLDGWTVGNKAFEGYGVVYGNAYIYGKIDQFEKIGYLMSFFQTKTIVINGVEQKFYVQDPLIAEGETKTINAVIKDGYGADVTNLFTGWKVARNTGNTASDNIWNAQASIVDGSFAITWSKDKDDLGGNDGALFTVTAQRGYETVCGILQI